MENHPIPQDVTGFKFKLVGSITLKEFGYILGGGIMAVIIFVLPQPNLIFRLPFMVLFGGIGAALAFVPIEGRPLDKMIYLFARTVPSENEYLYHKKGINLHDLEYFKPLKVILPQTSQQKTQPKSDNAKRALFYNQLRRSAYKPDDDELQLLKNVHSYFNETPMQKNKSIPQEGAKPAMASPIASYQASQPVKLPQAQGSVNSAADVFPHDVAHSPSRKAFSLDSLHPIISGIDRTHGKEEPATIPTAPPPAPINRERPKQAGPIPQQIGTPPTQLPMPAPGQEFQFRQKPAQGIAASQNLTPQQAQIRTGFPNLPDKPNIILGIVKDPRGKVLPNILVEVLNNNGLSVRAFKTNTLGQFASATPLPDGEYSILLNDTAGRHEFQKVIIRLEGKIFQPVEITSVDARERLRRELFEK